MTDSYRADIDGLRALAVVAIILFHIDPGWMPGGLASLSIFFVVSGYLITANIDRARRRGTFSFTDFYARRAKRILPAAFLVIAITLIVGLAILTPADIAALGQSSVWSILMLANVYFYEFVDVGYFARDARELPLLHLWSLGVEEQFYAVWPALLVGLLWAPAGWRIAAASALAIASFAFGEWILETDADFAYYMFVTRAGELLTGAIAALIVAGNAGFPSSRLQREAVASIGVLLMAHGLLWLDEHAPFPGLNAIPVSVGTALIILAGHHGITGVSRILALRACVAIGLISYPLYLWHWPIFAFVRYAENEITPVAGLIATATALIFAALTYALVENPARNLRVRPRIVWLAYFVLPAGMIGALGVAAGSGAWLARGSESAYLREITSLTQLTAASYEFPYSCQTAGVRESNFSDAKCVVGASTPPRILLWGDSKAAQYVGFLDVIAREYGFSFRTVSIGSCPAILSNASRYATAGLKTTCDEFSKRVTSAIDGYDLIIVGSRWHSYDSRATGFRGEVSRMVQSIRAKGKTVVLLGDVPAFPRYHRDCALRALRLPMDCRARARLAAVPDMPMNRFLKTLAERDEHVHYLDVSDLICTPAGCSAYLEDRPIYYDNDHLSMSGSSLLGRKLLQQGSVPEFLRSAARPSR